MFILVFFYLVEIQVYQLEELHKQKEGTCIVGYDATCVA